LHAEKAGWKMQIKYLSDLNYTDVNKTVAAKLKPEPTPVSITIFLSLLSFFCPKLNAASTFPHLLPFVYKNRQPWSLPRKRKNNWKLGQGN
jgi:hypothetical protein